jgi:exodeoxyribonuclease V gamma subunit
LAELVGLQADGMRGPLPLVLKTSHRFVESRRRGMTTDEAVGDAERNEWTGRWFRGQHIEGERDDDAHVRIWGPDASLSRLFEGGESHEFATLAQRLWEPLLDAESTDLP